MSLPVAADVLPAINTIIEEAEKKLSMLCSFPITLQIKGNFKSLPQLLLQRTICEVCGVLWEEVTGEGARRNIVMARHLYCYFAKHFLKLKPVRIAEDICKDHATVLKAIITIKNRLLVNDGITMPLHTEIILKFTNLIKEDESANGRNTEACG